jgi:hypothetical protein
MVAVLCGCAACLCPLPLTLLPVCVFLSPAESTLRLLCKVFDVETATVSLLTGERIYLVGACGALPVCVCPDRWGFCGWSFLNPNHEVSITGGCGAGGIGRTLCVALEVLGAAQRGC